MVISGNRASRHGGRHDYLSLGGIHSGRAAVSGKLWRWDGQRGAVPPLVAAMSSCHDQAPLQSWMSLGIEESKDLAIVLYC